jgi:hypothetical protein
LSGDTYRGEFKTVHGRWAGKALKRIYDFALFIKDPPAELDSHDHSACFMEHRGGWHLVHFTDGLLDLSAGIAAVERILRESFA